MKEKGDFENKEIWSLKRVIVIHILTLSATDVVPQPITAFLDILGLLHSLVEAIQPHAILPICLMFQGIFDGSTTGHHQSA